MSSSSEISGSQLNLKCRALKARMAAPQAAILRSGSCRRRRIERRFPLVSDPDDKLCACIFITQFLALREGNYKKNHPDARKRLWSLDSGQRYRFFCTAGEASEQGEGAARAAPRQPIQLKD